MSLNPPRGSSEKPSQRFRSAVRRIKRQVNVITDRLKPDDTLDSEPQPEDILHISPPMTFEVEILSGFYRAGPQASSLQTTGKNDCIAPHHSQPADNSEQHSCFAPPETLDIDCIHVRLIPSPRCPSSTRWSAEVSEPVSRHLLPGKSSQREPRRWGIIVRPLSKHNPSEQPSSSVWCPSPTCDETNPSSLPHFSGYGISEIQSHDDFAEVNRASKVSISVPVSIAQSSFGPDVPLPPLEEQFNLKEFHAKLEKLAFDAPLDFTHRISYAGKSKPEKRESSFGMARIIISTPHASQASQLSPSFKTWLVEFIENRLNSDESAERLANSFEAVITEKDGDLKDHREVHPHIFEEYDNELLDPTSDALGPLSVS